MQMISTRESALQLKTSKMDVSKYVGTYQPRIDENDFSQMLVKLSIAFGIDYQNVNSINYLKAKMTFQMMFDENYSKEEFQEALNLFIRTKKYATWTPADFLEYSRPKIYSFDEAYQKTSGTMYGFKKAMLNGKLIYIEEHIEIKPPFEQPKEITYKIISPIPNYEGEVTQEDIDKITKNGKFDSILQNLNIQTS